MLESFRLQLLFGLSDGIGSHVRRTYRDFLSMERLASGLLADQTEERLGAVLRHAAEHVPYYRERVTVGGQPTLADFPVLAKADIGEHFAEFMAPELRESFQKGPGRGYSWIQVKTGGSSGVPTTVIHDASFRDQGRGSRLYSQALCGFPFGRPHFRLWGSMAEISRARDSLGKRVMSALSGEQWLNAFLMDEARMTHYVEVINRSSVEYMMAYFDAAVALANFVKRRRLTVRPLSGIMACAGTVTDSGRALLQDVFKARVHNKYGSRECTDMACECEHGGLHRYSHHAHLEVVDDQGRPVEARVTGRLLVTLLGNPSFPLIRYEIGDMAALSDGICPCGRPFPLLERLEGRKLEFLTSTRGGFVSPVYIRHLIGVVHNPGCIRCFQLIQERNGLYRLSLVLDPEVGEPVAAGLVGAIRTDLLAVLGGNAVLEINRVSGIPTSASGKFLYTMNRSGGAA